MLSTLTAGSVRVDPEVFIPDFNVQVLFDFGYDVHRAKRSVAAFVGIEGTDADEAMDAAFSFAVSIGVLAHDAENGAAESGLVPVLEVLDLAGETGALSPTGIHAKEHVGPVAGFGATRSSVDREDRVATVMRSGQERLEFHLIELGGQRSQGRVDLGFILSAFVIVGFANELDHGAQVVEALLELPGIADGVLEHTQLGGQCLSLFLLIPEAWHGHLVLDFFYAEFFARQVKETSIGIRLALLFLRLGKGFLA